jgi:octopine/nopaline transport system ATP-binding protein
VIYLHQGLIEEQGAPQKVFGNPVSDRCRQFVSGLHH